MRLSPRSWLLTYLLTLASISFIHSPLILALLLPLALLAAGPVRPALLKRTLKAALPLTLTVSLAYAGLTLWQGRSPYDWLLLMNVRVLLMVFLGFWLIRRVNLLQALEGWPTLSLLLTLALGQIETYRRLLADFALAFASRNPTPASLAARTRHGAAQATTLLDKSLAASTEASQALRSRGVFDA